MKFMAHRGFSGIAPENTIAAFKKALEIACVDSFELDVQLSKDGVPVVFHDFTLNRTTNGSGYVKDKTFEELKTLDAGCWFSKEYVEEKIPSLEEVFFLLKDNDIFINIELKTARNLYPRYEENIIELLMKYGFEKRVCLTSFDHEVIKRIRFLNTKIPTGLIIQGNPVLLLQQLNVTGASILSINADYLTPNLVSEMIANGIKIVAWTVNEITEMKRVLGISKDITICTNFPDRFLKI